MIESTAEQHIEGLLMLGWSMGREGILCPPEAQTWTIKEALSQVNGAKPNRETVRRACVSGEIQAERAGKSGRGHWEMRRASFELWLDRWQKENQRIEWLADKAMISSLGGRYDPAEMIFPDPRLCGLILLDARLRDHEFVEAFLNFHRDLNIKEIDENSNLKVIMKTRAKKILWISDKQIPEELWHYAHKIEEWII